MRGKAYQYDAFISHAVEDKIGIANELCERLEAAGLKVWYSGAELSMGDSIENSIREGLASSRFGIIIFSHQYISKTWALQELAIFREREYRGEDVILPILYQITIGELATRIPAIVDRFAISSEKGMDHMVQAIVEKVRNRPLTEKKPPVKIRPRRITLGALLVMVLGLSGTYGYMQWGYAGPPDSFIDASIKRRIDDFERELGNNIKQELASGARVVARASIDSLYAGFQNLESKFRNNYEFSSGLGTIRSRKNVVDALDFDVASLSPFNNYGFGKPSTYLFTHYAKARVVRARYTFLNDQSPQFRVEDGSWRDDQYRVEVWYANNIKCITVELVFPNATDNIRYHTMYLYGVVPHETFVFSKDGVTWKLVAID